MKLLGIFTLLVAGDFVIYYALWMIGRALSPDVERIRLNRRQRADIREALARPDAPE